MSRKKELNYFTSNWHRGIEWYKSHFMDTVPVRGEASPNYTSRVFNKGVASRMNATVPDAKLIYIIRDPIKRILSQYVHLFAEGSDKRTINEALQELDNDNAYVASSKYYMQLEEYLAYYPKHRILILTTEELYADREETLTKAFRFLGVSPSFKSAKFEQLKHPSSEKRHLNTTGLWLMKFSEKHLNHYHPGAQRYLVRMLCYPFSRRVEAPRLDKEIQLNLEQALREDVRKLREFSGNSFSDWSI